MYSITTCSWFGWMKISSSWTMSCNLMKISRCYIYLKGFLCLHMRIVIRLFPQSKWGHIVGIIFFSWFFTRRVTVTVQNTGSLVNTTHFLCLHLILLVLRNWNMSIIYRTNSRWSRPLFDYPIISSRFLPLINHIIIIHSPLNFCLEFNWICLNIRWNRMI